MVHKLKGFGFLVSGLVLGIIGAVTAVTAIVLSGVGIGLVKKAKKSTEAAGCLSPFRQAVRRASGPGRACRIFDKGETAMDYKEILSHVDHTLLKPEATWPQIQTLCDEAIEYGCASVCINTCYVKQAVDYMAAAARCAAWWASLWAPWTPLPRPLRQRPPLRTAPLRWIW